MKENYVILIFIAVVFVIGFLIRKKYPPTNTYNFWISLVAIAIFTGIYVRQLYREGFVVLYFLLYAVLIFALAVKVIKSYKLMRK